MRRIALVLLALAHACGDSGPPPVTFDWDPGAGKLSAFPDDAFTVDDPTTRTGLRLDLAPERIPELLEVPETYQEIFRAMSSLDGFGLSAGAMLRFDGALDPASVWSGETTASAQAPILLVVDTADGPRPWPYEATLTDEGMTVILEPMAPLPPRTTGFLAVTTRLRTADGRPLAPSRAMAAALAGEGVDPVSARVAPRVAAAAATLAQMGAVAAPEEVVGAVPFTTQSAYEDALAIAADVRDRDLRPAAGTTCTPEELWIRCEGTFTAVDYRGADQLIEDIGAGGAGLDTATTYVLPFTAWLPLTRPGPWGGEAFPTLVFGHGLGGERQQAERLAEFAAPHGLATVAIDAVMHGEHPTAESRAPLTRILDFFAISAAELTFEPLRMRDAFRQSTYDKLQLVRLLTLGVDLDGDGVIDLDPARLAYLGVSLGGIMGPELLALAPELEAAVLVVPGGRVSSIVRDAQQFGILVALMKPEDSTQGDVDRFFPVLQTCIERGDAAVWAPYLLTAPDERPAGFPPSRPHVLAAMVLDDDTVPNSANRALVRALGLPIVPPVRQEVGLVGTTGPAPVAGNLPDGRTAGLLQLDRVVGDDGVTLEPATHSNIGDSSVGVVAWLRFLDGWLESGQPVIVDPYAELGL